MNSSVEAIVVDAICRWSEALVRLNGPPRINVRLVFGNVELADDVGRTLSAKSGSRAWYIVRSSSSVDAVRLRHGRPQDPPPGVTPKTPVIYVLFWLPGERGHERNAQSLHDLRAVDVQEMLARSEELSLPAEEAIAVQCDEAADGWAKEKDRERARRHLKASWLAVRTCLRERNGGRQRSIPFVARLDDYARFLVEARVPAEEWASLDPAQRAGRLVERWGMALPCLAMFRLPALAMALGVPVDCTKPVPEKKNPTGAWIEGLAWILADNIECAMDFSSLHDVIAGKSSVEAKIADLAQRIALSASDPEAAKKALVRFCHDGWSSALRHVDWLFWEDSSNRRSASLGLKGFLMARGRRKPTENPLDRAAADTGAALKGLVAGNEAAIELLDQTAESWKHAVDKDGQAAVDVAGCLRLLAAGAISPTVTDAGLRNVFTLLINSSERKPEVLDRLAGVWLKFAEAEELAAVRAPTLLLGLARLFAKRLREGRKDHDRVYLSKESGGDVIVLTVSGADENEAAKLEIPASDWSRATLQRIQEWLNGDAARQTFLDGEEEDEEEESSLVETGCLTLRVGRKQRAASPEPIGSIELAWSPRERGLIAATRPDALMSWKRALDDRAPTGLKLLTELINSEQWTANAEAARATASSDAWSGYVKALGRESGWDAVFLVAPIPGAARAWVDAWSDAVGAAQSGAIAAEAAQRHQQALQSFAKAKAEGRPAAELMPLMEEIYTSSAVPDKAKAPDVEDIRSLLRACTASANIGGSQSQVVLTPHHPLVLRLRGVADDVLADVIQTVWKDGWPAESLDDLEEALDRWGIPEPVHCYGFWSDKPLVFESWLTGSGFGLYSNTTAANFVCCASRTATRPQ